MFDLESNSKPMDGQTYIVRTTDPGMMYRSFLRGELDQRLEGNPRYSLRGFARDLKMSSSQLSDILNGKQGLSLARAKEIASTLRWEASRTQLFCDLVEAQHARSRTRRQMALAKLQSASLSPSGGGSLESEVHLIYFHWTCLVCLRLICKNQIEKSNSGRHALSESMEELKAKMVGNLDLSRESVDKIFDLLEKINIVKMEEGKVFVETSLLPEKLIRNSIL